MFPAMSSVSSLLHGSLLIAAVGLAGCATVLGIEDAELGGGPAVIGDFSCLATYGKVAQPDRTIAIKVTFLKFEDQKPATDLNVSLCRSSNVPGTCPSEEKAVSDAKGVVSFDYRIQDTTGFTGYLKIEDSRTTDQISVKYLLFFYEPLTADKSQPRFYVVSPGTLNALHDFANTKLDPTKGSFSASAFDCGAKSAAIGAQLRVSRSEGATRWYLKIPDGGGAPGVDPEATAFDAANLGGFFNVSPGLLDASAVLVDGRTVSKKTLFVQAGYFSTVDLEPNQKQ